MKPILLLSCLAIALQAPSARSAENKPAPADDPTIVRSEAFLSHHPDLNYRLRGLQQYRKGEFVQAYQYFRRAARYGDKPSQAMIGGMFWRGEGVLANRALAYAWMDLASERGYQPTLVFRERYWAELTEGERRAAVESGQSLYREFGDAVAKKRLNGVLLRARRNITGSRVGYVGTLVIEIETPSGTIRIPGEQFYQDKYWQPEQYWRWQDSGWKNPPRGDVSIGPLQVVTPTGRDEAAQPPRKDPPAD